MSIFLFHYQLANLNEGYRHHITEIHNDFFCFHCKVLLVLSDH